MTSFGFDPTEAPAAVPFELVKPGWYYCTIVESAMRPTKAGVDSLALTYEIDANNHPDNGGRKIFDNLNINHQNDKPREISRRNLSAICLSTGIQATNTDDLLGGQMLIKVSTRPAADGYDAKNEVKGYKPKSDDKTSAKPSASASASAKPSAAGRPWAK